MNRNAAKNRIAPTFKDNPYFEQYLTLLIELHDALRRDDEEKADAIRERMDEPGYCLSPAEVRWVNRASADLYLLANAESFRPRTVSPQMLMMQLKRASDQGDGETMLDLLRQADFALPEHRAWFRSRAYEMLGYYSLSLLFLAFAADQRSEHFEYKYMLLAKILGQRDFVNARILAFHYADEPDQHPKLKILIAIALYRATRDVPPSEAEPLLEKAVNVASSIAVDSSTEALSQEDALMLWMILGACQYELGNIQEALAADTQALQLDPTNTNVLESRGRHQLRTDYANALVDFRRAVTLETPLPFPYLFLIREELLQRNYEAAKSLCDTLLARNKQPRVIAQAYEFLALAYYGLGRSLSDVQQVYGRSLKLVPSERRQRNYQSLIVGSRGIVPEPEIMLPLLTIEEVEAIEDDIQDDISVQPPERKQTELVLHVNGLRDFSPLESQPFAARFTEKLLREDLARAA